MTNYNIKLDLSKLCTTTTMDIQGKTGKVKCVVIPVEENGIFLSDRTGNIYLDFTAYERKEESFGQTHFIKQRVGGTKWKAMTDEERMACLMPTEALFSDLEKLVLPAVSAFYCLWCFFSRS